MVTAVTPNAQSGDNSPSSACENCAVDQRQGSGLAAEAGDRDLL